MANYNFRRLFTNLAYPAFVQRPQPTLFLKSYFPTPTPGETPLSETISFEVRRGTEKVAIDVPREASDGNLNTHGKSTETVVRPPFFWEQEVISNHKLYENVLGELANVGPSPRANRLMRVFADEMSKWAADMRYQIDRAYELQCAQLLEDGIVQLNSGENIDYGRKAASKITLSTLWNDATNAKPINDLDNAAEFIRKEGLTNSGEFDFIFGRDAFNKMMETEQFKTRADLRHVKLIELQTPRRTNNRGANLWGYIDGQLGRYYIWTYPQFYEDANGTKQSYMDTTKVVGIPTMPEFSFGCGLVPQTIELNGAIQQQGEYLVFPYKNDRAGKHELHVKSAGVPIPLQLDQVFTFKATDGSNPQSG